MGMTAAELSESFGLLLPLWPDLHTLADEAEQNADKLPDFSTIRLRNFSEAMVCHLFRYHGLPLSSDENQFDRLQLLQHEEVLDRRVLGLLHTIRKLGNIAAHGKRPVSTNEARDLIDDARSLAAWFCLHMRPDIDWHAQRISPPATTSSPETPPDVHSVNVRETRSQTHAAGLVTEVRLPK